MFDAMSSRMRRVLMSIALLSGLFLPLILDSFWIQLFSYVFATAIAAIGLMLLFGRVGQLSLGHPFFLAVGAYSYVWVASPSVGGSWGLGLPSILGIPAAALIAGLAGLLISPVSSRVRGLHLGLATLAFTFTGLWIFHTLDPLTGGYNGRSVPILELGPFSSMGAPVTWAGVTISSEQFLWYVTLILLAAVSGFTANLLNSRVGRAFTAIRDAEIHAATMGVEVMKYRVLAFALSSAYAGLAGALLMIITGWIVPDYWGLELALGYLAMIIIGGMRSIVGAILGAAFVTALPTLLQHYSDAFPFLDSATGPSTAAAVLYGLAVVVILLFEPLGLVRILERALARIMPAGSCRRADAR